MKSKTRNHFHVGASVFLLAGSLVAVAWAPRNESPRKDLEANWLPAPRGPFSVMMRLYWPKDEAVDGRWQAPPIERLE